MMLEHVAESSGALSVIMPVLNAEDTIEVQLAALARQSAEVPWELIVVDNGCSDLSMQVVESYRGEIKNLRTVRADKIQGAAHARNVGASMARAPFLAFCDADDQVSDDWVEQIFRSVQEHGFVASRFDATLLSTPRGLGARGNGPQLNGLMRYNYVSFLPFAGTCGLAVRRDLHEQIDGFDETLLYLEDCDYCWRVQLQGTRLIFAPNALVHIRHRHDTGKSFRQAMNWGEYNVLLIKRYQSEGMPKPRWWTGLRLWAKLALSVPKMRRQAGRDRFLWKLAYRIGHVRGSVRHRIFAP